MGDANYSAVVSDDEGFTMEDLDTRADYRDSIAFRFLILNILTNAISFIYCELSLVQIWNVRPDIMAIFPDYKPSNTSL